MIFLPRNIFFFYFAMKTGASSLSSSQALQSGTYPLIHVNYFVRTRTSNTPNNEDIPQEKRCVVCLNQEKEVGIV